LEEAVQSTPAGRALDVAMGRGRNAIFLASRGWDVTGFDVSDKALSMAADEAARTGASVHAVRSTSQQFDYGEARWDLLVLCYAWAPISDPAYAARLQASLRPGGVVVFEHFLHVGPEAPPQSAGAPDPGQLPRLFANFEIVRYEEVTRMPEWLPLGRREQRPVARMIARKPA
jgi:SAM-dependent methyltransferase